MGQQATVTFYRDVYKRVFARVIGHPSSPQPHTYVLRSDGTWSLWSTGNEVHVKFIESAWEKHLNKIITEP